jgi:hypothetical protein
MDGATTIVAAMPLASSRVNLAGAVIGFRLIKATRVSAAKTALDFPPRSAATQTVVSTATSH